jgi:hypothetical protein
MNRTPLVLFLAGLTLIAAPALAGDEPDAFVCSFKSGVSWSFDRGKYSEKPPAALTLEFDNIDLEQQRATLKAGANSQPGAVAIARAIGANHFLEVATEGFWNITTIYEKDAAAGVYPAVHSRHLGLAGSPVFSQYAGTCTAK